MALVPVYCNCPTARPPFGKKRTEHGVLIAKGVLPSAEVEVEWCKTSKGLRRIHRPLGS